MNRYLIILFAFLLAACAKDTGVVSIGADQFMVTRQGDGFWETGASLRAEAIELANQHCGQMGKSIKIERTDSESAGFFKYPEAEVIFSCE